MDARRKHASECANQGTGDNIGNHNKQINTAERDHIAETDGAQNIKPTEKIYKAAQEAQNAQQGPP